MAREFREFTRIMRHLGYHRDLPGLLSLASFVVGFSAWSYGFTLLSGAN